MRELFKNLEVMLSRFRASSLLNVIGMAVSFSAVYIILVQVNYDLFFNCAIPDSERVYRVECPSFFQEGKYNPWTTRLIPENCIQNISTVEACGCGFFEGAEVDITVLHEGGLEHFNINYSEISMPFIDVFGMKAVSGNFADLKIQKSVALSSSTAKQIGLEVGDSFYYGNVAQKENSLLVVAIFADFPNNTDLSKMKMITNIGDKDLTNENRTAYNYYVKLSPDNDIETVSKQANLNYAKRISKSGNGNLEINMEKPNLRFVSIQDTFFKTDVEGCVCCMGNKWTTYMLLIVAILIVVMAFINFVNFFFALIPVRIKSINLRKIFGCSRVKLRVMLVFESVGLVIIALLIAVIIILYIEDTRLAQVISTPLNFSQNLNILAITVGVALILSLFASLYPAYYITSHPVAFVLKGSFGASKKGLRLRYVLVGLQFTISITLIICAMFVHLQNRYMMHYDMGFNKEMVLTTDIPSRMLMQQKNRMTLESKLRENPVIEDVICCNGVFVAESRECWGRDVDNKQVSFQVYFVSWNFLKFLGIKMEEGRDFLESDAYKEEGTFIFNTTAKNRFGLTLETRMDGHNGMLAQIAGFCRDINTKPLQYDIEPFAFYVNGSQSFYFPHLYFRVSSNADLEKVSDFVKNAVSEIDPLVSSESINIEFFDEELQRKYEKEQNLSLLIMLFSFLAIIISLMGVFGLVMFETQYRMKEIAIRRVHGASISQILKMFNVKFVKIVVVCFAVSVPISYCFISYWLKSFAYQLPIYGWVFAVTLAIMLIIIIATVTARSYSAATSDPAKLVKTE